MTARFGAASDRAGAVVIGGDYQGLAIARSLGRRGVPVCVIDDEHSISRWSRYVSMHERVPDLRDEEATVAALTSLAGRRDVRGWVLFPTRDETVAAIAEHRDELEPLYRVPTPAWDVVRWAWDKRNTYALATSLDIPTPRTWCPADAAALEHVDVDPPYVLKPAVKPRFLEVTKAKAWRADTRDQLRDLWTRGVEIAGPGGMLVQELVPGDGCRQFGYCSFFKDGRSEGTMVVRRRRQHPPEFGRSSTYVQTIDLPEIEAMSTRLLQEIDYYGLVEVEYKSDPDTEELKLLDLNARTWGYHSLGGRAGVDFPWLLYADQTGLPTAACHTAAGLSWMRLVTDLPTAVLELRAGRLDVRGWLRSLRRLDVEATFSRDDPLPMLAELLLVPYLFAKRGF